MTERDVFIAVLWFCNSRLLPYAKEACTLRGRIVGLVGARSRAFPLPLLRLLQIVNVFNCTHSLQHTNSAHIEFDS